MENKHQEHKKFFRINEDYRNKIKDYACHCTEERRQEGDRQVYSSGYIVFTCSKCGWQY